MDKLLGRWMDERINGGMDCMNRWMSIMKMSGRMKKRKQKRDRKKEDHSKEKEGCGRP